MTARMHPWSSSGQFRESYSKTMGYPRRQGVRWSVGEDMDLFAAWLAGTRRKALATAHERSHGAINSRLTRILLAKGLLKYRSRFSAGNDRTWH